MLTVTKHLLLLAVLMMAIAMTATVAKASIPGANPLQRLSKDGLYRVNVTSKVVDRKVESHIALFRSTPDGWQQEWIVQPVDGSHPGEICVDNDGVVVAVGNTQFGVTNEPALVIYRNGKITARYSRDDLRKTYGEPVAAKFVSGTEVMSVVPTQTWYRHSYMGFDPDDRFCVWDDAVRAWVIVDLKDGSLIKADDEAAQHYAQQARKQAYEQIKAKDGKYCYEHYYTLAHFLRREETSLFQELLTKPNLAHFNQGHSSGPGDIFYFTGNQERELADWALAAIDRGEPDATVAPEKFVRSPRHEGYRELGAVTISATFPQVPTRDDGAVFVWLDPVDTAQTGRPDHVVGIRLRFSVSKPLVMPVKMYVYGVIPGEYHVRGYWDKNTDQLHEVRDTFWKRTGQFVIADDTRVEVHQGAMADVDASFQRQRDDR